MSKYYVKKRISLDFLGEEYKDAYLSFKTIPVAEYESMFLNKDKQSNIEATIDALNVLKNKFVEGKFPNEDNELDDVKAEDLVEFLDEETLNHCYLTLLGQKIDPKS